MARDGRRAALPALTADGVKRLFDGSVVTGGVLVQVLGVYRHLVDPALKRWVGPALASAMDRDAFDLLVSDGQLKMKCLLSPALNQLVWKRRLQPLDVISISKFESLEKDSADGAAQQRVCVVHKLKFVRHAAEVKKKIVRPRSEDVTASDGVEFISADHEREVALVPLASDRRYYLPLSSDHYSLDRAGSFAGKRNNWSPSGELDAVPEGLSNVEWVRELNECPSLFTKSFPKVYTLREVAAAVSAAGSEPNREPLPPMVGTVRVKSKVAHLGDPNVTSDFPFAFHIVLVDRTSVVEIAFYGSMCAKCFLGLQEGDLVQLRDYKVVLPRVVDNAHKDAPPVYFFEHNSAGSVFRVPEKYWKMLQASQVIPAPIPMEISDDEQDESKQPTGRQTPRWVDLSFVSTLNAQFWSEQAMEDRERLYFDFVGVLSFVGKVCRRRVRRRLDSVEPSTEQGDSSSDDVATEYRWVKAIDNSSSNELVILIEECSQPNVFRSLVAGNFFMATKLQWVVLGSTGKQPIQHVATSSFSVLRLKRDISPFLGVEECRLNAFFARDVNKRAKNGAVKTRGESCLEGDVVKTYSPTNSLPSDAEAFMRVFAVLPLSFRQLRQLHDSMETFECQHVALVASVGSIVSRGVAKVEREANVFMDLGDLDNPDLRLTVRVAVSPLFRPTALLDTENPASFAESLPLMRIMSPSMLRELYCHAVSKAEGRLPPRRDPAGHRLSAEALTLNSISGWLATQRKGFFSLRLFRNSRGHVEWEVDAIFPAP